MSLRADRLAGPVNWAVLGRLSAAAEDLGKRPWIGDRGDDLEAAATLGNIPYEYRGAARGRASFTIESHLAAVIAPARAPNRDRSFLHTLAAAALLTTSLAAAGAEEPALNLPDLGGAPAEEPIRHPCNHYNCGTILSIRHHRGLEPAAGDALDGPGTYVGVGEAQVLDPADPFSPVIADNAVEKVSDLWEIQVRMQDGTVQTIRQDYAPFFQVGDEVLVEDGQIQLAP
jgi:hypothetical protein